MIDKLKTELSRLEITLVANTLNPEFSDYVMKFNDRIIGYGWQSENVNEKVGFMGWSAPAWENCIWRASKTPGNLNFEEIIELFQFAISEDYLWFSPPVNRVIIGPSCEPYQDATAFILNLKQFIESEFNPKIFSNYLNNLYGNQK